MARKIDIEHLNTFTAYLAEKIYDIFVRKQFGKGLSENDYTDEEKAKLSGIAEGANRTVTDDALSATSGNPVQNKAVKAEADRLQGEINQKVPSSRTINGHALTGNVSLNASDVGADASGSASNALQSAKTYADNKIVDLIGGAPETLDTLKEVADALEANADVVEALDAAIGTKASTEALQAHINHKSNPHGVSKADVGLGNVENKTGAAIRGEMTKAEVEKALGYTPSAITNAPDVATNDQTPTFTQADTRANIASGEKLAVILGKIMKWYADLKGVAFSGSYNDLSNRPGIPAAVAVKGNAESSYRTGNVNLTPANLGAAAASHTHTAGQVSGLPSSLPANGGTANYANYLNATNIPANANLNSYTTPGLYYCPANATVATMSNKPTNNAFFMLVGKHAGTFQMLVEYMTSGFKAYMRNYYSGTWGAWVRMYTTIDKPTLGDIGAAASGHTHGAMSGATASVAGETGLVPTPAAGAQGKYLRGDGTWAELINNLLTTAEGFALDARQGKALDDKITAVKAAVGAVLPQGLKTGYVLTGLKSGATAGTKSTAEGDSVLVGSYAHAEGVASVASGIASHAEGGILQGHTTGPQALEYASHAEGLETVASGKYSHSENQQTVASGQSSHAEGLSTTASGSASHAEGNRTVASGGNAHAEGLYTTASGNNSHAGGANTIAGAYAQMAIGYYNVQYGTNANALDSFFIIGNGSSTARSNAFRVAANGTAYGKGSYQTSGADYAEFFEWEDGNPNNEDRRGYFVTLEGNKIRKADSMDEYILGVISAKPVVVGNSDPDDWVGRLLTDEYGNFIMEEIEEEFPTGEGTEIRTVMSYVINPDYNPEQEYVPRSERPEWSPVGMMGVLAVRDDGSCKVNGYCKVTGGGTGTFSPNKNGYRVTERVNGHLVKIIFR